MGGKNAKPTVPSYEPYQCCPAKPNRATRVAKVSRVTESHKVRGVSSSGTTKLSRGGTSSAPIVPALKPINKLTAKDSRKIATISEPARKDGDSKAGSSVRGNTAKAAKGKKGFFGSGKYLTIPQVQQERL